MDSRISITGDREKLSSKKKVRRRRDELGRRVHVDSQGVTRVYEPTEKRWIVVDSSSSCSSSSSETLLLEGPAFTSRFDFAKGEFHVNSKPLVVKRASETRDVSRQKDGDTGRTIWDGAVVLAKYLEEIEDTLGRVIEVGAGVGLAGLAAAACSATHVVLTDLPYTLKTLKGNVGATLKLWDSTTTTNIEVTALDWTDLPSTMPSYDTVLSADCVWIPDLVPAFVNTLTHLRSFSKSKRFRVLLSHQTRSHLTDRLLFSSLESNHFTIKKLHPKITTPKIQVFELT